MHYRKLGSTGLNVPQLCFGTSRFAREVNGTIQTTGQDAHELLDACMDRGLNFFDTANIYGDPVGTCEQWIGEWLTDHDREEVILASKVRWAMGDGPNESGLSRKHVRDQVHETLNRLGTDYLDLYYIHGWDDSTPILETLRTLTEFVREGKINYLGASNLTARQLVRALWMSDTHDLERFEVIQPHYNAAYRNDPAALLDVCAKYDLAVCPYAGLAGGFLTGKYEKGDSPPLGSRGDINDWEDRFEDRQWRVLDAIRSVADEVDASSAQVALRWLVDEPRFTCIPIVAARTISQLDENCAAADLVITPRQWRQITDAYEQTSSSPDNW